MRNVQRDVEDAVPYGSETVGGLREIRGAKKGVTETVTPFSRFLQVSLLQMRMAFLGQLSAQVPQPTQRSSSSSQVLAALSTVSAPAGHFLAQSVQ